MSAVGPESPRFACPTCGKRYSVEAGRLEESAAPLKARCSRCGTRIEVRSGPEGLVATAASPAPEPATAAAAAPADVAPARDGPEAGQRLGRYEVEEVVGRGGMGTVYRAFDPATNRHVALKVLPREAPEADVARFEREIQVQGNVQHPNIMPIFDSGTVGSLRYYTMDLLREPMDLARLGALVRSGEALRSPRLKPVSTLPGLVQRVMLPLCDAVHHANHREGVLHRDVTPTNVVLDVDGLRTCLIDFGVCTLLEHRNPRLAHLPSEGSLTSAGPTRRVSGTLLYMPPEQARGQADRRGDVWALGALLHFLVTGDPPVAGASHAVVPKSERIEGLRFLIEQAERAKDAAEAEHFRTKLDEIEAGIERTQTDVQRDVLRGTYQPRPAWLDPALDAVIAKAMAADPERRYRNAKELRQDLEAWLAGRAPIALAEHRGGTVHALYASRQTLRRLRVPLLVLLLLAAGAWALLARMRANEEDERRATLGRARDALAALLSAREPDLARHAAAAWAVLELDPRDGAARERLEAVAVRRQFDDWLSQAAQLAAEATLLDVQGQADPSRAARVTLGVLLERGMPGTGMIGSSGALLPRRGEPWASSMATWEGVARDERPLLLGGLPDGARVRLRSVDPLGRLGEPRDLGEPAVVTPGRWVLAVEHGGRRTHVAFEVPRELEQVQLPAPPDLSALPPGLVLVPGGRVKGPLGEATVRALSWEPTEVTVERYAAWLDRLPEEERTARVPRLAGRLGAAPRPLWSRRDGRYVPPGGSSLKPVDGISLYDARAFAAAHDRRLPTAQEWAWAASGPFGGATPLGALDPLYGGAVAVGRDARGPRDVGSTPGDQNVHGLFDLAGNVAEWTASLTAFEGVHGWLVMGSGYGLAPERALVTRAQPEPGWMPLQGVGFRLVRDLPESR